MLQGPRLFLLIHALELWGRGLELGTKFRRGGAGRQPGIHTRCTRNVQAECLASLVLRKLPSHPTHTSLPSCLWSAVLSLILLRAPADLPNSSPPPLSNPPQTLLAAEFPKNKSFELITEFIFLKYNFFLTWDLGSTPCPLNAEDAGLLSRLPRVTSSSSIKGHKASASYSRTRH